MIEFVSRLPAEYQEVKYIESSGTQFFRKAPLPTNTNFEIEARLYIKESYGVWCTNAASGGLWLGYDSNQFVVRRYAIQNYVSTTNPTLNTWHTVKITHVNGISSLYIDGVLQGSSAVPYTEISGYNYILGDGSGTNMKARLGHFKYKYNGSDYENLIPCYRKSDNVAGVYDLVNGVFYTNAGTGTFAVGANAGQIIITAGGVIPQKYALRRRMMHKPSRLPFDYQEVEYIQSSGTQYIDTGFVPSYSTRVVMRAIVQDYSANGAFFGARTSSALTGLSYSLILLSGGTVRSDYYGTEANVTTIPLGEEIKIDKNKNVCTVNGATATNTASTSKSAYPLFLFAVNTAGTASLFGKLKIPETEIYDGEELVIHYIPCYRKTDNVAGLYDLVNSVFYTNAGTGTFAVGSDV